MIRSVKVPDLVFAACCGDSSKIHQADGRRYVTEIGLEIDSHL